MFEIAAKEDQKMQVRRSFILIGILSLTVLLLTTVALVQRQLAQQKKSENEAAAATNERPVTQSSLAQSRRMNSDGLEFERTLVRGVPFSAKQGAATTTTAVARMNPHALHPFVFMVSSSRSSSPPSA